MINPNEAPDGYIAVDCGAGCDGCDFLYKFCNDIECTSGYRKDGHDVMFVKDEIYGISPMQGLVDEMKHMTWEVKMEMRIKALDDRVKELEKLLKDLTLDDTGV